MQALQSAHACSRLQKFVRAYAQRDLDWLGPALIRLVPASLEHVIEFEFGELPQIEFPDGHMRKASRIAVVGSHTRPGIRLHLRGRVQSFAIFFEPLGLWQLFRLTPCELADRYCEAPDLLGSTVIHLWQRLGKCATFTERVACAQAYLLGRAESAASCTPIMNAAAHLSRTCDRGRLATLAKISGLGVRQFERRFSQEIGISPKLFARISRFQMALESKLMSPERTWLSVAHDHGYHDQMHMIHDFHALAGTSPGALLADMRQMHPPVSGPLPDA